MTYQPNSKILILTICSFTKTAGGVDKYNEQGAIVSRLSQKAKSVLLQSRANVWYLLELSDRIDWQGVPASELAFNQGLVQGIDLGGYDKPARYLPALQRYDGRFFQALGRAEERLKLLQSKHHFLFISGLYGLVIPAEPIQLYSCPLKPQVAEIWTKDNALTDVLISYVLKHGILRILDLTAVAAYRNLIDWSAITAQTKADVLHCFYNMGAGDSALIPFGQLARDFLLKASESELLSIKPETEMNGVVFRSVQVTQSGLPDELRIIQQAEREIPLLEAYPAERLIVREVLAGGLPIKEWMFSMTHEFRKEILKLDKKMEGRVMGAIVKICRDPMTQRGDTEEILTGQLRGKWRYRLGDYRLIYQPDKQKHIVFLLAVGPRGGVYGD